MDLPPRGYAAVPPIRDLLPYRRAAGLGTGGRSTDAALPRRRVGAAAHHLFGGAERGVAPALPSRAARRRRLLRDPQSGEAVTAVSVVPATPAYAPPSVHRASKVFI